MEAVGAVKNAGGLLLNNWEKPGEIITKGKSNYVTHIDYLLQEYLIKKLSSISNRECTFISEEKDNTEDFKNVWVIDPLDGTTNFMHGYPHCAINVAHVVSGEVVFAATYNPVLDEMFVALKGRGAYLNSRKIQVSVNHKMEQCIVGFGLPYDRSKQETIFSLAKNVFEGCQDIKRKGAASLDLADVACGRLDGYFELDLKAWDYFAGYLLITEAGGQLYETNKYGYPLIVATNGIIDKELFSLLQLKNVTH